MPHKRAKKSVRDAETSKKGYNLAPTASSERNDTPRSAMRILNSHAAQEAHRARGKRGSEDTGERPRKKARPAPTSTSGSSASAAGPSSRATTSKSADVPSTTSKSKAAPAVPVPSIRPHESLGEYNRRVESLLRGGVSAAIKSANAVKTEHARALKEAKEERKRKAAARAAGVTSSDEEGGGTAAAGRSAKDKNGKRKAPVGDTQEPEDRPVVHFKPAPGPRRLNDIAQAPPSLPRLKAASKAEAAAAAASGAGAGMGAWATGAAAGAGAGSGKRKSAFSSIGRDPLNAGQKRLLEEERERVVRRYREMKEERERERVKEQDKAKGALKGGAGAARRREE